MDRNTQLIAVVVILVLALAGFAAFILFAPKTASQAPTGPQDVAARDLIAPGAHMTGTTTAAVTLVEWGDFECPFCGQEAPILEQIIQKYGNNPNFNFVFRNFPLPQHANARIAAEAAEAAGAQGKFWQMYAALYAGQNDWVNAADPKPTFDKYAVALGLNVPAFDAALAAHTYAAAVDADYQKAMALGLDHTPSLFLNGHAIGSMDYASLSSQIDTLLASTTQK